VLHAAQLIRGGLEQQGQVIMKVSFVFGTIHLSLAQLRQALRWMPSLRSLSHVGWTSFLWGMLLVIWYLFFGSQAEPAQPLHPAAGWLLLVGTVGAIVFAHPSRNPLKMLGLGLASFPLSAIGTFSDTISYIRLMVVGVASAIIAQTFNSLGAQCAAAATWLAGAPIVVIGHAMNVALCLIAILAHGVRLNMLEFSSNAGLEWSGYAYEPFAEARVKESG
jgi:V/A-type H+-transporting ATPase subunit I